MKILVSDGPRYATLMKYDTLQLLFGKVCYGITICFARIRCGKTCHKYRTTPICSPFRLNLADKTMLHTCNVYWIGHARWHSNCLVTSNDRCRLTGIMLNAIGGSVTAKAQGSDDARGSLGTHAGPEDQCGLLQ